jgi:hypothetical protein
MNADSIINNGEIKEYEFDINILNFDERIPSLLVEILKKLGHNKTLKLGPWNIISISEMTDYNIEFYKNNITHIHNFAYMDMGMGWLYVAAINLNNGKVFIHEEGGSNGFEVKSNLNKSIDCINKDKIYYYLKLERFLELIQTLDFKKYQENFIEIQRYIL